MSEMSCSFSKKKKKTNILTRGKTFRAFKQEKKKLLENLTYSIWFLLTFDPPAAEALTHWNKLDIRKHALSLLQYFV